MLVTLLDSCNHFPVSKYRGSFQLKWVLQLISLVYRFFSISTHNNTSVLKERRKLLFNNLNFIRFLISNRLTDLHTRTAFQLDYKYDPFPCS